MTISAMKEPYVCDGCREKGEREILDDLTQKLVMSLERSGWKCRSYCPECSKTAGGTTVLERAE